MRMNKASRLFNTISSLRKKLRSDYELSRVLKGGGVVLLIQIAGAGLSFIATAVVARLLGVEQYGIFAFYLSLSAVLVLFGGLGVPGAAVKFVAEYRELHDYAALKGFLRAGYWLTLATSAAIAVAAGLTTAALGVEFADAPPMLYWTAFAAIPILAIVSFFAESARGFLWPVLYEAPVRVGRPLALMLGVLALHWPEAEAAALTATAANLIGALLICSILQVAVSVKSKPTLRGVAPRYELSNWLGAAVPMLASRGFGFVLMEIDVLMTGLFLPARDVALYQVAARTSFLVAMIGFAQNAILAPRIAALFKSGKTEAVQGLLTASVRITFVLSAVFGVLLMAAGKPVLSLFGSEFANASPVLAILVISILLTTSTGPLSIILNMTGRQKLAAMIMGGAVVLNVVLHAIFIPLFGLFGAALAVLSANAIMRVILLTAVRKSTGLNPSIISWRNISV